MAMDYLVQITRHSLHAKLRTLTRAQFVLVASDNSGCSKERGHLFRPDV